MKRARVYVILPRKKGSSGTDARLAQGAFFWENKLPLCGHSAALAFLHSRSRAAGKQQMKERNRTIDLTRFVFSILIVPIHADLFMDVCTPVFQGFTVGFVRMGVPFFFIVSGFFLAASVSEGKSIKKNIWKNLKMWLIFLALDIVLTGRFYYPAFSGPAAFLHKALFTGLSDAYWFMPVLVVTQLFLIPVFKKKKYVPAIEVGLILYLFSMTHDSYSFLFEGTFIHRLSGLHTDIFIFPQGGLVESVFFLSLGGFFYERKDMLTERFKNRTRLLFGVVIVLSALLVLEAYLTQNRGAYDGNCYLSLILLPSVLFLWALIGDPVKADTKRIGVVSLYVYLVHPIAVSLMRMVNVGSVIRTLAATVAAVAIGFLIVHVSEIRRERMLKEQPR